MPVRNEEEYIRASLESLVDQCYPASDYEIIVVDGRSSDLTREIIKEIRERNPPGRCSRHLSALLRRKLRGVTRADKRR